MRVYSIIEEMLERDLDVILIGSIVGIPWLHKLIEQMVGEGKFIEEKSFISEPFQDILIIDSYTLNLNNDFLKKEKWLKIVALLETGTPRYLADLYIHCGTNKQIGTEFGISNNKLRTGLSYLPIRKSIRDIRFKFSEINARDIIKILVVGGGTDPLGFVPKLAKELLKIDEPFRAILFSNEPNLLSMLDHRFIQKDIGDNLEEVLIQSGLVLTLAGTSSWEFLSCGFPIGIALGFENQKDNFEFQTNNKIAINIGRFRSANRFIFDLDNIKRLVKDQSLRLELSRSALNQVDNFGGARIVEEILKLN
jgi:spore coat polysaccharide biosynthesis predicted glycosyltransferase SpsG